MLMVNLRARRLMLRMKQKEIAAFLGITYQQYQKYEYGLIKPNIERFIEIVKVLRVPNNIIHDSLLVDYGIINIDERRELMKYF